MYFITCFSRCEEGDNGWFDGGYICTFGYYDNFYTCKKALNENWGDMHEYLYKFAVVEFIEQGIQQHAKEIAWFQWDNERQGFFETDKPNCTFGVCNHAFG